MPPQLYPPQKLNGAPRYRFPKHRLGSVAKASRRLDRLSHGRYCVKELQRPAGDEPRFLACGIFKPHSPFFAPSEYHQPYRDIDLPVRMDDDWDDLPTGAVVAAER